MTEQEDDDEDVKGLEEFLSCPSEKDKNLDDGVVRSGDKKGCFEKWGADYADDNASTVSSWAQIK